ncbi:MAG: adenylyltransferase/cytidyltransferase family protein [Deltaproteobacteria bacterium]|jgi:glycerol-3-phosphate cytidylyltransferase|nr:adenylyltransferase/cytidyltransferase family protein [Deltaproteobacteria bacterium]
MQKKRIMVDMSATLLHHGHVRLLKQAARLGGVVVALTTDDEVEKTKGYKPELDFAARKEILESIRYVDEVVPCPWLIDDEFLQRHNCDLLLHGDDNSNHIPPEKLVILPRTQGISSSSIRERVLNSLIALNLNNKPNNSSDVIARLLIETIKKEFRLE